MVPCDLPAAFVIQKNKTKQNRSRVFPLVAGSFLFPATCFIAEREDVCSTDRMHFYLITVVIFIIHMRRPHFFGHY